MNGPGDLRPEWTRWRLCPPGETSPAGQASPGEDDQGEMGFARIAVAGIAENAAGEQEPERPQG